jgi:BirA family transcriptional regulator, biotin operon repressor / biotin---[acetyl-CoA-carboxylase] ligase
MTKRTGISGHTVVDMNNERTDAKHQGIRRLETQYAPFARQAGAVRPDLHRTAAVADEVVALAAIDSTNILGRKMISDGQLRVIDAAGAPRMVAICADAQSAGHGRLGRQWSDKAGGASFLVTYCTALPRRLLTDSRYNGWFTIVAGLAALDALSSTLAECGANPLDSAYTLRLKWPNDIFCNGHKLGGILTELVELPDGCNTMVVPRDASVFSGMQSADSCPSSGDAPHPAQTVGQTRGTQNASEGMRERAMGVMFGIGINLDIAQQSLPTPISTSLQLLFAPLPDPPAMRDMIASKLTQFLRLRLAYVCGGGSNAFEQLHNEAREMCWTLGRKVEVNMNDGLKLRGEALFLNDDASLSVQDEFGVLHVVRTADVGVIA